MLLVTSNDRRNWRTLVGALSFGVLILAGLVLAFSWAVNFPPVVLDMAWIVAFFGAAAATVTAWLESRASGESVGRSLRESLRALKDFIIAFF